MKHPHIAEVCFDIELETFVDEAASRLHSLNSESASSILSCVAKEHFVRCADKLVARGHALRRQQASGLECDATGPKSLRELGGKKLSLGLFEITLCQSRAGTQPRLTPVAPTHIKLARSGDFFINEVNGEWYLETLNTIGSHDYPYLSRVSYTKRLKTIEKTRFKLFTNFLSEAVVEEVRNRYSTPCSCEPSLLMPHTAGVWNWIVRFTCRICGKTYYCSCFREAFDRKKPRDDKLNLHYTDEQTPDASDDSLYRDDLCHLCRQAPSDLFYCSPMYGNSLQVRYGAYIVKTALSGCKGNPEDEVRLLLGIPSGLRWVSEFELFAIVKELLPEHIVYYQARPDWLSKQSLDIFVPSLGLGIEYQGRQHYEPVEFFGGEAGFHETQQRDAKKLLLCEQNGVTLIYFKHSDRLTKSLVKKRLNAALENRAR